MTLLLGALLVAVAVGLLSMAMREAPDQRGVARSIALIGPPPHRGAVAEADLLSPMSAPRPPLDRAAQPGPSPRRPGRSRADPPQARPGRQPAG